MAVGKWRRRTDTGTSHRVVRGPRYWAESHGACGPCARRCAGCGASCSRRAARPGARSPRPANAGRRWTARGIADLFVYENWEPDVADRDRHEFATDCPYHAVVHGPRCGKKRGRRPRRSSPSWPPPATPASCEYLVRTMRWPVDPDAVLIGAAKGTPPSPSSTGCATDHSAADRGTGCGLCAPPPRPRIPCVRDPRRRTAATHFCAGC